MSEAVAKIETREIAQTDARFDPMVSMIERIAMNPAADIDKLERLLAMKERADANNARIAFSESLALARAEIPPIIKDATVDFTSAKGRTHYQHETLAGIARTIDPILSRFGLSYRFKTGQTGQTVAVTCIIAHSSGYSEETALSASPDVSGSKNSFQAIGSAVTYLQRYTLKAALGLSAEADDDAQRAAPRGVNPAKEAFDRLADAASMDELATIWGDLPPDVKRNALVSQAKEARKRELSPPEKERAPLVDDKIPY